MLGGYANICYEFATKRYRSNCINWGIVPFTLPAGTIFNYTENDYVYIPDVREKLLKGDEVFPAKVITNAGITDIELLCQGLTNEEKLILTEGCLMNYYAAGYGAE